MPSRRPMAPVDIRRQVVAEELELSLDGRLAVVARRAVRGIRYVTHLYAIPLDAGRVGRLRRLTSGLVRDGRPRLSPDGRRLAFVRSDATTDDHPASVVVVDVRSGAIRVIPRRGHGAVGEIAWSPDGRRLACTAEVDLPRFLVGNVPAVDAGRRRAKAAAADPPSPLARRISRVDWRWDGEGHQDRWSHLFVIDARRGARARQVTAGDWGVSDIAWAPDGRTVAFSANRGRAPDLHPRPTIWAVDVDGGSGSDAGTVEPHEAMAPGGFATHPAYSPDGRWLAAIGVLDAEPLDDISPTILLGPADGSAPPRAIAPDLDRPVGNWADTDLNGWMISGRPGPYWLDPATIVTTLTDRGRSHPVRFELDPETGTARRTPSATPSDAPGPWSDATAMRWA